MCWTSDPRSNTTERSESLVAGLYALGKFPWRDGLRTESLTSKADLCYRAEEKTFNVSDASNELKALRLRETKKKKKKKNEVKKGSDVKAGDEYLHQKAPSQLTN